MFLKMFASVLSLIAVMSLGYYITKIGILNKNIQSNLSDLLLKVTLPVTLILSLQIDFDKEFLTNCFIALLVGFVIHILSLFLSYYVLKLFKTSKDKIGIFTFAITFCNLTFVGIPVLEAVLGSQAVVYTGMFAIAYNILSLTIGIKLVNYNIKTKLTFRSIFSNPVIGVLIGLFLFSFSIKIPNTILTPMNYVGNITSPLSLLLTGSIISNSKIDLSFFSKDILLISFIRLLIVPALITFMLIPFPIDDYLKSSTIIGFSMPSGLYITILANKYGGDDTLASKLVVTTTILSLITMPIVATLFIY